MYSLVDNDRIFSNSNQRSVATDRRRIPSINYHTFKERQKQEKLRVY
jgi:hypothetical protein